MIGSSEFRDMCLYGPCPACGSHQVLRHEWQPDGSAHVSLYCPAGCSTETAERATDERLSAEDALACRRPATAPTSR